MVILAKGLEVKSLKILRFFEINSKWIKTNLK